MSTTSSSTTKHEALALENNFIKQRKPRFNILLRDDKTYPYVKLTLADRYPKVFVTRRLRKDGSAYYGPYFPGNLAYRIADLMHRSFLLPSCKVDLSRYHPRPCLQYYIKRCLGPCVEGFTTPEEYREAVRDAQLFLEGRQQELGRSLETRMDAAAASEQFELAAKYRDLLITVNQVQEKQRIASADSDDADVFGYHYENDMLAVNLFHMRGGKIVDRRDFFWEDLPELVQTEEDHAENAPEAAHHAGAFHPPGFFSALLKQLYIDQQYVPRSILVPVDFADRDALCHLLAERTGHRVEIAAPQRGEKRSLVDLVGQNAKQSYDQRFRVLQPSQKAIQEALQDAADAARAAAAHRVLRHLAYPGRGDRRLDGGVGERRDEEVRLPQVSGEDGCGRGRLRLHARDCRTPLQARLQEDDEAELVETSEARRAHNAPRCPRSFSLMAASASCMRRPRRSKSSALTIAAARVDRKT